MRDSWPTKTLEDVCEFSNGLWKGKKPPFVRVGVVRMTNFADDGALDDSNIAQLDVEVRQFEKRRLQFGDVILEKSGGGPRQAVGRVCLFDKSEGDFSFSNFTSAIRVRNPQELDFRYLHKFLYWIYLSGVTEGMQSHSTGIRNLNGTAYKGIGMSLPPLPEQRRAVGILDAAFEGIAAAKANAEATRQSARALFESCLDSAFSRRSEEWVQKRLEQATDATCTLSYGIVQPGEEHPNGLPVVRPKDLTSRVIPVSGLKRVDPKRADAYARTALHGGELLLCVRGTTGVVSVASAGLAGANVTRGIVPIRFDAAALSQDFGYYLLRSGAVQRQVREKTYGAALMQINIRDLRQITVSFPPLKEQAAVVGSLDELSSETGRLESLCQSELADLDELKKALLEQAFTGQLGLQAA